MSSRGTIDNRLSGRARRADKRIEVHRHHGLFVLPLAIGGVIDAKTAQRAGGVAGVLQCNRDSGLLLGDAGQQLTRGLLLEQCVTHIEAAADHA